MARTDDRFEVLLGGRTNRVWKILGRHRHAVLKLYRNDLQNPLFRNDPKLESLCLRELELTGIAPKLLGHGPFDEGDWVLYDHAPGSCWSCNPEPVAQVLHRLHQVPPPADVPDGCNGSSDLEAHGLAILSECRSDARRTIGNSKPVRHLSQLSECRLIHGDPVPGNVLMHDKQAILIDWQCPAVGDPCEDLAMFLSPAMQMLYRGAPLTEAESQLFLAAYPDNETVGRYAELRPWYHWRMAAYCLWRQERGAADYGSALELELAALDTC
ncbi:phosphotransferase [Falsiruegeria litorea]|uniref:phosphotransferase n=1 Tax=Falsiruegeria litorea TaxID=1280831 RepID=UPI001F3D71A4|nr:phosphotransferase [Falsiruegeria litorea]